MRTMTVQNQICRKVNSGNRVPEEGIRNNSGAAERLAASISLSSSDLLKISEQEGDHDVDIRL